MNYSPIANPEVKLCLPSATVTVHIFPGSWQESWRSWKEKEDDQCFIRYSVSVAQEHMIANKAKHITVGAAVLVRN